MFVCEYVCAERGGVTSSVAAAGVASGPRDVDSQSDVLTRYKGICTAS